MKKPAATYRVQLHKDFGFPDVAAITGYLAQLGVSHLYCSPYLEATPGSTHGYDVINHDKVNPELGGEPGHAALCAALERAGLGQVLDIVPNHMATGSEENQWWWDVLENGPSSQYAAFFDVDWEPPEAKLRNLVLMPILGDQYGVVLENGEIQVERHAGCRFVIRYHDHTLPAAPRSISLILSPAAERSGSELLAFLSESLANLPAATSTNPDLIQRRQRDKVVIYEQLDRLATESSEVSQAIDTELANINRDPDALDILLDGQNFRLAFWRTAGRDLGYRRFFDINTLIGIRTERDEVFNATHHRILDWLRRGVLDGLRVDHPDGLRDALEYFRKLSGAAPQAWIVAEKILEPGEALPENWPVAGSTGYDFIYRVNNIFVHTPAEAELTRVYTEFTGESADYEAIVLEKKELVLRGNLGSDVNRLTAQLLDICERHRRYRDYTRHDLHQALRGLIACFPVYRTYVRAEAGEVAPTDIEYVTKAVEAAKANRPEVDARLFDFIGGILLLRVTGPLECEFVMRFQQFTGTAMAKGVEDTTFYVYNRLTSLNEVGGNPGNFGLNLQDFHQACIEAQQHWPESMTTMSTHDTKRGEDVRARINVISEIPEEWEEAVRRWSALNERHREKNLPGRNEEYLLYQTLVGAWPIELDRVRSYMLKAAREGKAHTSWTDQNAEYEKKLEDFVASVMGNREFVEDLERFLDRVIPAGRINSLAQTLIKFTAPGIPDTYQGAELWNSSLVDPDNRRPVDYDLRRRLLAALDGCAPEEILRRMDEGLPKLWVTHRALRLRNRLPDAFGRTGEYCALKVEGPKADHVIAFSRGGAVVTIAPRFNLILKNEWSDTRIWLPDGAWGNEFTGDAVNGGAVPIAGIFARFPVALLSIRRE